MAKSTALFTSLLLAACGSHQGDQGVVVGVDATASTVELDATTQADDGDAPAGQPDADAAPEVDAACACAGIMCGDDGCGGSCGTCDADQTCDAGVCVAVAPADDAVIVVAEGLEVIPQTVLHLSGAESPTPSGEIGRYAWSVVQPVGSRSVFLPDAAAAEPEFEANVVGVYVFELTVWDAADPTWFAKASYEVIVATDEAIHIELLWQTPGDEDETDAGFTFTGRSVGSDLDLHFAHPDAVGFAEDGWFDPLFDCYWSNKTPNWHAPLADDNPSLDRDDTDGAGPENINLAAPTDGLSYRIGVHYWDDWDYGSALATVRVYVHGDLAWERTDVGLRDRDMWEVATVAWPSGAVDAPAEPVIEHNYWNEALGRVLIMRTAIACLAAVLLVACLSDQDPTDQSLVDATTGPDAPSPPETAPTDPADAADPTDASTADVGCTCAGLTCGLNACGTSCGECGEGASCAAGVCVTDTPALFTVAEGDEVIPQTTLHLRADEQLGENARYEWSVVQPVGSQSVFLPNHTVPDPSFEVNVAGTYAFDLKVWETPDTTAFSQGTYLVHVIPDEAIHVEFLWDTPNDPDLTDEGPVAGANLDLHFRHQFAAAATVENFYTAGWFDIPWDTFWYNPQPNWGTFDERVDDDPSLDRDDTDGAGPENLNLAAPEEEITYTVGVHYWNDHGFGTSYATVRVYLYSELAFEIVGVALNHDDVWEAARIAWPSGEVSLVRSCETASAACTTDADCGPEGACGEAPWIMRDYTHPFFPSGP